jgi:hypothetical protein
VVDLRTTHVRNRIWHRSPSNEFTNLCLAVARTKSNLRSHFAELCSITQPLSEFWFRRMVTYRRCSEMSWRDVTSIFACYIVDSVLPVVTLPGSCIRSSGGLMAQWSCRDWPSLQKSLIYCRVRPVVGARNGRDCGAMVDILWTSLHTNGHTFESPPNQ